MTMLVFIPKNIYKRHPSNCELVCCFGEHLFARFKSNSVHRHCSRKINTQKEKDEENKNRKTKKQKRKKNHTRSHCNSFLLVFFLSFRLFRFE